MQNENSVEYFMLISVGVCNDKNTVGKIIRKYPQVDAEIGLFAPILDMIVLKDGCRQNCRFTSMALNL